MQALSWDGHKPAIVPQEDDDGNDEVEEGDELLNLCEHLFQSGWGDWSAAEAYEHPAVISGQPYESTETSWAVQSRIEDMYDICAYSSKHKSCPACLHWLGI